MPPVKLDTNFYYVNAFEPCVSFCWTERKRLPCTLACSVYRTDANADLSRQWRPRRLRHATLSTCSSMRPSVPAFVAVALLAQTPAERNIRNTLTDGIVERLDDWTAEPLKYRTRALLRYSVGHCCEIRERPSGCTCSTQPEDCPRGTRESACRWTRIFMNGQGKGGGLKSISPVTSANIYVVLTMIATIIYCEMPPAILPRSEE